MELIKILCLMRYWDITGIRDGKMVKSLTILTIKTNAISGICGFNNLNWIQLNYMKIIVFKKIRSINDYVTLATVPDFSFHTTLYCILSFQTVENTKKKKLLFSKWIYPDAIGKVYFNGLPFSTVPLNRTEPK